MENTCLLSLNLILRLINNFKERSNRKLKNKKLKSLFKRWLDTLKQNMILIKENSLMLPLDSASKKLFSITNKWRTPMKTRISDTISKHANTKVTTKTSKSTTLKKYTSPSTPRRKVWLLKS
jgi:hypothetical protein